MFSQETLKDLTKQIDDLKNISNINQLSKDKNQLLKNIKGYLNEANKMKDSVLIKELQHLIQKVYDIYKHEEEKNKKNHNNKNYIEFLPANENIGTYHPITITTRKIYKIMKEMKFEWFDAPEVDYLENIFEKLNMDELHPAREDQQSFYIKDKKQTLRTHCTNFQAHILSGEWTNSLKKFHIGKVYRCDSDATHTPMFHQFEVLYVNEDGNLSTLMGFIKRFLERFFEEEIKFRIRTSYFPFTTPSYEVDILLDGKWLEIGGCGIVHQKVFEKNGKSFHNGWAWGMGVERLTMISNKINDIRNLYKTDIRYL